MKLTEQQIEVLDQLRGEGAYGDDRESVVKRLLELYAREHLPSVEGAR